MKGKKPETTLFVVGNLHISIPRTFQLDYKVDEHEPSSEPQLTLQPLSDPQISVHRPEAAVSNRLPSEQNAQSSRTAGLSSELTRGTTFEKDRNPQTEEQSLRCEGENDVQNKARCSQSDEIQNDQLEGVQGVGSTKMIEYEVSEEEQPDKACNTRAERIENQPVEEKQTTQREKVTEIIKGRETQIEEPKQELSPQIIPDIHKVRSSSQPMLQTASQYLILTNETNHDHPPIPQTTSSQPPPSSTVLSTVSPSLQVSVAAALPLPSTLPSPICSPVVKQPYITETLSLSLSPALLLTSPQSVPNFALSRRSPITSFTAASTVSSAYLYMHHHRQHHQ